MSQRRADSATGSGVPNLRRAIVAGGDDAPSIGAEGGGVDGAFMREEQGHPWTTLAQRLDFLAVLREAVRVGRICSQRSGEPKQRAEHVAFAQQEVSFVPVELGQMPGLFGEAFLHPAVGAGLLLRF